MFAEKPGEPGRVAGHEPPAQRQALHVARDVGAPGRVEEEFHGLGRPGGRQQGPPGHLPHHHVGIGPVDVQTPGGVAPHRPERLARLGYRRHDLGVVSNPERVEVGGDDALRPGTEDRLQTEVGQALGEQALGGAHQEDGLLHPSSAPDQPHLLAAVLGVVSGIGLVGHEMGERGRQNGKVGVHRHARMEIAQIGVEARPRLVLHQLEIDVLAFGESEETIGPLAQLFGQRGDGVGQSVGSHDVGLAPGDQPVADGARFRAGPRTDGGGRRRAPRRGPVPGGRRSRPRPPRRSRWPLRPDVGPSSATRRPGPEATAGGRR